MRVLFWLLLAFVDLLDAAATLCAAVVVALFGLAWAVSFPFQCAAWALVRLSRRISTGSAR